MQGTPLTTKQKSDFLNKLVMTGGNVTRAAKVAGISRSTAYAHRNEDADFALAWDEAIEAGVDELEQEIRRRALKGTRKPVYHKGKVVGYIREYSDSLAMFIMKRRRPEYREHFHVDSNVSARLELTPILKAIDDIYGDGEDGGGDAQETEAGKTPEDEVTRPETSIEQ